MKRNNLIITITVLAIAIVTVSCEKWVNDENSGELLSIPAEYKVIGEKHNEGLDYIFEELSKNKIEIVKTRNCNSDVFELIKNASASFALGTSTYDDLQKEDLLKLVNNESIITKQTRCSVNSSGVFSDKQMRFVNKYMTIIETLDDDINVVINELMRLQDQIISSCNNEEKMPLLTMISVGCYSLQYWNENLHKWDALNPNGTKTLMINPRTRSSVTEVNATQEEWEWFKSTLISMGQSDGIGAGIGAGLGALAGGVGAIPGAVMTGCNASAGAGIKELFIKWGIF